MKIDMNIHQNNAFLNLWATNPVLPRRLFELPVTHFSHLGGGSTRQGEGKLLGWQDVLLQVPEDDLLGLFAFEPLQKTSISILMSLEFVLRLPSA